MFSTLFIGQAFLFAVVTAVYAGLIASLSDKTKAVSVAIIAFVVGFIAEKGLFYYDMPALYGVYFGYGVPLAWALALGAIVGCVFGGGGSGSIGASVLTGVIFWSVALVAELNYSLGPDNARNFAEQANISVAADSEQIPPTDPKHMVLVTPEMAALNASQALNKEAGKNYSTRFKIGALTLQSIKGHRFYAAPLVPTNNQDTFWTPFVGGRSWSPGFVLVDAENEEARAELHDGFQISLFEGENWSMNIERFVYLAGFDKGTLDTPKFEIDDDMKPHWVISYLPPAFGGIAGYKLDKVIDVDVSRFEPKLTLYNPDDKGILWADRIVSHFLISQYVKKWGTYGQSYAKENYWHVFFGLSTQDVIEPADGDNGYMLSYTADGHCVWVIPMSGTANNSSGNSTNHAVAGVLVFDTQDNKGRFYPGLRGFSHGGSVGQTMAGAPANRMNKYDVGNLELYNIYGHLTWVGIYTHPQASGATFGGIGFLNAYTQNVADVAYGGDVEGGLENYMGILARGGAGPQVTDESQTKALSGTIWRIGQISGEKASWRFQLVGEPRIFEADTSTYSGMPLVRDGDKIVGKYMDTDQKLAHMISVCIVGAPKGNATCDESARKQAQPTPAPAN